MQATERNAKTLAWCWKAIWPTISSGDGLSKEFVDSILAIDGVSSVETLQRITVTGTEQARRACALHLFPVWFGTPTEADIPEVTAKSVIHVDVFETLALGPDRPFRGLFERLELTMRRGPPSGHNHRFKITPHTPEIEAAVIDTLFSSEFGVAEYVIK
jgi:hypothetical protein